MRQLFWGGVFLILLFGVYLSVSEDRSGSSYGIDDTSKNEVVDSVTDTINILPGEEDNIPEREEGPKEDTTQMKFLSDLLRTDTSQRSIELSEVLDGGPGKDGIPAINNPEFLTQDQVRTLMSYIDDNDLGIVVTGDEQERFYPYAILNWHEIVNDEIDGNPISVTFCPLCGSAIVFDRRIGDDANIVNFGVSGKLWQSNLLMYDDATETLWSQAKGKGMIGEYTDFNLLHVDSDVMDYGQFKKLYAEGVVLSDDTGHIRSYAQAPYGDYDVNDRLFFPVDNLDARLPKKEILYVVNNHTVSAAFVAKDLREEKNATLEVDGTLYEAVYNEGDITVTVSGVVMPGYHEMFFSWATHNPNSKNIWIGSEE